MKVEWKGGRRVGSSEDERTGEWSGDIGTLNRIKRNGKLNRREGQG